MHPPLKFRGIALWIQPSPKSVGVLHICSSTTLPAKTSYSFIGLGLPIPPHVEEFFDDVDSWIKYMETDCEGTEAGLLYMPYQMRKWVAIQRPPMYISVCQ